MKLIPSTFSKINFYRSRTFYILLIAVIFCCGKSKDNRLLQINGKEVACFIYHRFDDPRYPTTNTPVKDFETHLKWLRDNNFTFVTFEDAVNYVQSSSPTRKTACITIDDGYKSFFKNGYPLLKKYNIPATLFINTNTVGGGDYMSWDELRVLMKNGIAIANHTHTHNFFLDEDASTRYKTFKDEIELSQGILEKNLGIKPTVFTYPYGEFDNTMKDIVKAAGFKAAAAQNSGVFYTGSDMFQIPRFPMSESYSPKAKFIEKARSRALHVQSITPNANAMPPNKKPALTISFDNTNLNLNKLQCFIQGGTCSFSFLDKEKKTVRIQPEKPLGHKRRTIYTITVPDEDGVWHWFSYLWIDTKVKG